MKRIDGRTFIEYTGVDWEKFPNLHKLLKNQDVNKGAYLKEYQLSDTQRLYIPLLILRYHQPAISERWIYVGYDWLINKVKEDDALLAEYAILRMQRG